MRGCPNRDSGGMVGRLIDKWVVGRRGYNKLTVAASDSPQLAVIINGGSGN